MFASYEVRCNTWAHYVLGQLCLIKVHNDRKQIYEVRVVQTGNAKALRLSWALRTQVKDWHAQNKM
ncbi:hypothetical protein YTPLAS72_30970 [Nitrospira sp.]|nr:hypothetical protein YTPLAS72_30970 [Nitrospira sp.]